MRTFKVDGMKYITGLTSSLFLIDLICSLPVDERLIPTGSETKRVINGFNATLGQFPYVVRIRGEFKDDTVRTLCTASLITKQTALTAAHCALYPNSTRKIPLQILDGILGSVEKEDAKNRVAFKESRVHKGYNNKTKANDIATFIFKDEVTINGFIKPIALAGKGLRFVGSTVIAVGWGMYTFDQMFDTNLHYMEINVADPEICAREFRSLFNPDKQICSGQRDDTCTFHGDSGSPLVIRATEQDVSIGILSAGPKIKTCKEDRALYVAVSAYNKWIRNNSVGEISFVRL